MRMRAVAREARRSGFLLIVGVAVATGLNCVVTDYDIITDNDQSRAGAAPGQGAIVNTRGKAHLLGGGLISIWPDGTDEYINFVDQSADGTATLTAYNNYSTGSEPGFHDDLYCNPDWTGCAIFTAPDDNDENYFDGSLNPNCSGARSLSVLVSTGRYRGECGLQEARLGVEQKIAMLEGAVQAEAFGKRGLLWRLDRRNTTISVRNIETGLELPVPLYGAGVEMFVPNRARGQGVVWLDHAMIGPALRDYARRLETGLHTETLEVTIAYNGVPLSFTVAGGANASVDIPERFRNRANEAF